MTPVLFHPQAEIELIAAASYYDSQQEDLGKRFLSALEDGISRIKINPHLFPLMVGDVRRCLVRTFPFGILFRYRNERIEIIAIMYLKRNPGYWQERL
jgi:toxin ParE1/3/4